MEFVRVREVSISSSGGLACRSELIVDPPAIQESAATRLARGVQLHVAPYIGHALATPPVSSTPLQTQSILYM
ncbi:hypothetical protein V1478_007559 [Vespula squamosa]|uniref:Uncharacterized protein n=1 Tax=Vespula squamosa TaxID=30214 RepID=A0ABD2B3P0_VESSQ